jgi:photosystem II stability/assembly factor-like uncharacterized protein
MCVNKLVRALLACTLSLPLCAIGADFRDVLDTPAIPSPLASSAPMNGLAKAGDDVVAVGQRGHILRSADGGQSWKQASVPVSSDLVAVSFPTPTQGWAVGHDGVVLHSTDGGATWTKQLDGRELGALMKGHYEKLAQAGELGEDAETWLREAEQFGAQGAENPFLDVWFKDERNGFVVGAFNLILRTTDGGASWEPWLHRTDNPNRLHFYALRQIGDTLYLAGEQGLMLKLDEGGGQFKAVETPYQGTYFGLAGKPGAVLAFGLRGHIFRSENGGQSWTRIESGLQDGITSGTQCGDALVLVSQAGNALVSRDDGLSFQPLKLAKRMPSAAAVCQGHDVLVLAGPQGVRSQPLQ